MIISVGNISMGGTGKTPFTLMLAKYFLDLGKRVAILSRGYKGKLGYGTHVISDGERIYYTPPAAADEPYMMALNLPKVIIITGKERFLSYVLAEERFKPDIYILDDGFQHRRMPRDINILLLDHKRPVSTGFIFPFGYLREFPCAIKRANIIVFTRAVDEKVPENVRLYCEGKKIFFSKNYYERFNRGDIESLTGKEALLLSGIAVPKQFEDQMRALDIKVIKHIKYRDHYAYTEKEVEKVLATAKNAVLVTTEKDFVRIPKKYQPYFIYPILKLSVSEGFFETILSNNC